MASRRNTLKKSVKRQNTVEKSLDPFESIEASLTPSTGQKLGERHWTISGIRTRLSSFKRPSINASSELDVEDSTYIRRKDRSITTSVFYDDENMSITKSLSEPADFEPLDLKEKTMNELLSLLVPVSFFLWIN